MVMQAMHMIDAAAALEPQARQRAPPARVATARISLCFYKISWTRAAAAGP